MTTSHPQPEHSMRDVHLLDAVTIAGLTGGRAIARGVDDSLGCAQSSLGESDENYDRDRQRDVRSDTLSSLKESLSSDVVSVLSSDLGDIYFTDDELDEDETVAVDGTRQHKRGGGGGGGGEGAGRVDRDRVLVALTVEEDEDEGKEVRKGVVEAAERDEQTMAVQVPTGRGRLPLGFFSSASLGPAYEAQPHGGGGGGGGSGDHGVVQGMSTTKEETNQSIVADPPLIAASVDNHLTRGDHKAPTVDTKPPPLPLAVSSSAATEQMEPLASHRRRGAAAARNCELSLPSPPPQFRRYPAGGDDSIGGVAPRLGRTKQQRASRPVEHRTRKTTADGRRAGSSGGSSSAPIQRVPTVTCKVLVVGNAKCGKSSIISRFVSNRFSPDYNSTVGADYAMKDVALTDGRLARLQLWDIAGQDRFAKLTRAYFRRAKGAVVVCDVTREGTFDAIVRWKEEIDLWCQNEECELPVYLFANKCDLLVGVQDSFLAGAKMEKTCREAGFAGWHITSAKRGDNIHAAMTKLLQDVLEIEERRNRGHQGEEPTGVTSQSTKGEPFQLSSAHQTLPAGGQQACCA